MTSTDGMTADFYPFDMSFIGAVATRIINEVKGVNRSSTTSPRSRRERSNGSRVVSWREYVRKQLPGMKELGPKSETFHLFNPKSGEAISTQILHTLAPIYMANPQAIYSALKACVDAVADYVPTSQDDLALAQIKSRTIHLAVPELTSPVQWRYLHRAGRATCR